MRLGGNRISGCFRLAAEMGLAIGGGFDLELGLSTFLRPGLQVARCRRLTFLDSLRSPFGPACGCYSASLRLICAKKSKQKKAHPAYGPAFRCATLRVRSLHRRSEGTLRWAIHGPAQLSALASCVALPPASMQSSRHPCRSTPYTPTPLTLLTGLVVRASRKIFQFS